MSFPYAAVLQQKKMLANLDTWLDKSVAHAKAKSFDPAVLLTSRLSADMLPLLRQVQIACDHAKFTAARLAGQDAPKHPDTEQTIDDLKARIRTVRAYQDTFKASDFEGADARVVTIPTREGAITIAGANYLVEFAQPNFYFHVTTAYDILRHNGVDVGKRDFIGSLSTIDR
jgi:hypothetical protein